MKRYRLRASDGKLESVNQDMFDYAVLVQLNIATRTGDYVSVYELARRMYALPNARTIQNLRESLERARAARTVRVAVAADSTVYQIVNRRQS